MTSKEMAAEIRLEAPVPSPWAKLVADAMEARLARMPWIWRQIFGRGFRFAVAVLQEIGRDR